MEPILVRRRLRVRGIVQGVGFRPFVHRLATSLGVTGAIGNDDSGVWCEAQALAHVLDRFITSITTEAPPLASVVEVVVERIDPIDRETGFHIRETATSAGSASMSIPPDVAACARCLSEIADPADRRFRYPFTCCTECGPRYTVVRSLPYDRERTSLADFPMCTDCVVEYASASDRRHHAQATCCPRCGPRVSLVDGHGVPIDGDPIDTAVVLLQGGSIVAVKGVGGFQLMCRADDDAAVLRLRERKQRDDKPFALLVATTTEACAVADIDVVGSRALDGPETPIVLAPRRTTADVAASVAPDTDLLGVMLPATPLHALLVGAVGCSLVCTSGNRTDEPIAIDDRDALERLGGIADAVLTHDRRIERRADDSVGQSVAGRFQLLRRARGFAPRSVLLRRGGPSVLGVGAELKSTVCLAVGHEAHVSVHLGDLEHPRTVAAFEATIADQISLSRVVPELIVHDLHPEYVSTKFASAQELGPALAAQHHHAHLVSCLAENQHEGQAIGVTFDGLGWGPDGSAWGGEFLVGDATGYRRAAHLAPVAMPGGVAAIRAPWRMAVAHLTAAYGTEFPDIPLLDRHVDDIDAVVGLCSSAISTSSIGRLFDAVAGLCDLADTVTFEGQAAIRLEQAASVAERPYGWGISEDGDALVLDPAPIVRDVVDDLRRGVEVGAIAAAFHNGIAKMIVAVCGQINDDTGLTTVALSGGVFQNRRLVELVVPLLERAGFAVLRHAQVPPNDGGISLGQVAIGRALLGGGVSS
ncbi:MAG: carbamoyltransferase HypF [Ilumatobacteraceae bacterium]